MRKTTFIFICTVCFTRILWAQNPIHWNVSLGGSFPIGNYGIMSYDKNTLTTDCGLFDDDKKNGGAGIGLNIGGELLYTLKTTLNLSVSADVHYNPLNSDAKSYTIAMCNYFQDAFKQQIIDNGGTSVISSCSLDKNTTYLNIPLMVGLHYSIPFEDGMKIFAFGNVGLNIRCITPMRFTIRSNYLMRGYNYVMSIKETFSFSTVGTFAFRMGAGFQFTNNLSIVASYYYLGASKVFAKIIAEDQDSHIQPSEQNIELGTVTPMMVVLKLNYSF